MLIEFSKMKEMTISDMNHGSGLVIAKMYKDDNGKAILSRIRPGSSIGMHKHETSDDINYVISGTGIAICDGVKEVLTPETCHICKKGSEHSIENTGKEDLVLLTIVVER